MKLKILELFAGYGGGSFALKKAGIDFETVGYSEIDKYAIQCYEQNHKGKNLGDITKIKEKELPDFDLIMGGSPCQSFSVAGKQLGIKDKRGQLFWDIIRIAKEKQPKYLLLENVKGLTTGKNKVVYEQMKQDLLSIGYDVFSKVLNAKHYGIPQNRERVWFVCIRRDIKQDFQFPEQIELNIFLKDILEDEVDEKYYMKQSQYDKLMVNPEVSYCLDANYAKGTNVKSYLKKKRRQIIQINNPKHSNNRVYNTQGISPTINTMGGGNRQPFILQRGRGNNKGGIRAKDGVIPALSSSSWQENNHLINNTLIRRLTPREAFRLMGFFNDEIKLEGLSNTQKYHLAGNGWTIEPASLILKTLLFNRRNK